jgi:hypothetical protein
LHAIGGGAGLAGLVLWMARRRRRMRFPVHPGEFLLVLVGLLVAFRLFNYVLAMASLRSGRFGGPGGLGPLFVAFNVFSLGALAVVFVWAVIKIKIRRWRAYVCLLLGANLAPVLLACLGIFVSLYTYAAIHVAVIVTLVAVAVLDHRDAKRYAWPHWFGVATKLWFDVIQLATIAEFLLIRFVEM